MTNNYSEGKIYKIVCNTTGLIYIGSTTKKYLSQRLTKHVYDFKKYNEGKYHYVTSFKVLENNNYNIELLELCPCSCKDELLARESHFIRTLECVNKNLPGRTQKQYYQNNKEQLKEKANQKFTCQCGGCYTKRNKSTHFKSNKHLKYINSLNS